MDQVMFAGATSGTNVKPHTHAATAPNAVVEATRVRNLALQYKSDADRKADRVQMKTRMVSGGNFTQCQGKLYSHRSLSAGCTPGVSQCLLHS